MFVSDCHFTSGCHINVSSETFKGFTAFLTHPRGVKFSPIAPVHVCLPLPLIIAFRRFDFDGKTGKNTTTTSLGPLARLLKSQH